MRAREVEGIRERRDNERVYAGEKREEGRMNEKYFANKDGSPFAL